MYCLILVLLVIVINNIPITFGSYCNCVCPNLAGHHQLPQPQLLISQPNHQQQQQQQQVLIQDHEHLQELLVQHQHLHNVQIQPTRTVSYVPAYTHLENKQLLEKVLETQKEHKTQIVHDEVSEEAKSSVSGSHSSTNTEEFLKGQNDIKKEQEEDDGKDHHHKKNVHYKFEYAVDDKKTGDVKNQKEERHGDVVRGEYSLLEADGNVRTVKYYADWKHGFFAQIHNSKRGH